MTRYSVLLVATTCLCLCSLAEEVPRVFSEDFIEGLYGRFFEFTDQGNTARCPLVIDHFNRGSPSALGNSWIVPHNRIVQQGARCNDGGVLLLNPFDNNSVVPDALRENQIAEQTFEMMRDDSTGFWMGVDARRCGKWYFPNPSFVFFVREFDRVISSFFNLELAPGKKYMFVVAPTFTCIYEDITRPTPPPNVVINSPDGGTAIPPSGETIDENGSGSGSGSESSPGSGGAASITVEPTSTPVASGPSTSAAGDDSGGDGSAESGSDGPGSPTDSDSSAASTDGDGDADQGDREPPSGGDDELSIIDIAEGAQPPVQTPEDDNVSIIDIAGEGADGSDSDSEGADSGEEPADSIDGDSGGDDSGPTSVFEVDDGEVSAVEAQAGDSLCFAGDSLVELSSGAMVRMRDLAVGDEVRVGSGEFSTLFTFTHRMEQRWALFVELETQSGNSIQLTPGHLIYCNGDLMQAGKVKLGDVLSTAEGSWTKVTRVSRIHRRGIYNPQTLQGNIVVNGIVASTFTKTVDAGAAQGLLAPVRAWWQVVNMDGLCGQLEDHAFANTLREWLQPTQA